MVHTVMDSPRLYQQRRIPAFQNNSSASSLNGMEKTVPSFQTFLQAVPPHPQKALPPIPRQATVRLPSPAFQQRSSSLYSRDSAAWDVPSSWQDPEEEDEHKPGHPSSFFLQPTTYSSPQLVRQRPLPSPLEPRTYSPLIPQPSPSLCSEHSEWLDEPGPTIIDESYQKTWDKKTHKLWGPLPPSPPSPPPLLFPAPTEPFYQPSFQPDSSPALEPQSYRILPTTTVSRSPHSETGKAATGSAPQQSHHREASQDKALTSESEESLPRGRTRTRQAPPPSRYSAHYMLERRYISPPQNDRTGSAVEQDDEWQDEDEPQYEKQPSISEEYHKLLVDQYRELASPKTDSGKWNQVNQSDDEPDGRDIKLVPAPLFWQSKTRRRPNMPEDGNKLASNVRKDSKHEAKARGHGRLQSLSTPLKMLLPSQRRRESSTSGDIPISPPTDYPTSHPTPQTASSKADRRPRQRRPQYRNPALRVSTSPRARSSSAQRTKSNPKKIKNKTQHIPPLPLQLSASQSSSPRPSSDRDRMTSRAPAGTVLGSSPRVSGVAAERRASKRNAYLDTEPQPRPTHHDYGYSNSFGYEPQKHDTHYQPQTPNVDSPYPRFEKQAANRMPQSPHGRPDVPNPQPLTEGAVKSVQAAYHRAKKSLSSSSTTLPFRDRVSISSRPSTASSHGHSRHSSGESKHSRPSIFGKVVESRKEQAREKRREDLKKSIKFVAPIDPHKVETVGPRSVETVSPISDELAKLVGGKRETFGSGWF